MWRFFWYAVVSITILLAVFLFFNTVQEDSSVSDVGETVKIGEIVVRVEIADTPHLRERGLSGHRELQADEGMLFIFPEEDFHAFWMNDMTFPIDIVWISGEGHVVDIVSEVSPDTYPTIFTPKTSARYVLELPAGFVERNSIPIGAYVDL